MKIKEFQIHSFFLMLMLCMMLVAVNVLSVTAEESMPNQSSNTTNSIAWAENVRDNKVGANVGANFSNPAAALGEDDAVPGQSGIYSLGNALADSPQPPLLPSQCEAYLIVDFGKNAIVDGDGTDIGVFEVAANGVAEATWVYIGKDVEDSEEWLYAGKTGGSIEGVDISGVGNPGEQFNLVALCDFPDGYSSGWPVGGPDIDAIAALNFSRTGLVVEPKGPGWNKNGEALPENKDTPIDPGDTIKHKCPEGLDEKECSEYIYLKYLCSLPHVADNLFRAWALDLAKPDDTDLVVGLDDLELEELLVLCLEDSTQTNSVSNDPLATFTLQQGGIGIAVENEHFPFGLQTPVTALQSDGLNSFTATYVPDTDESKIIVIGGSLNIAPTAPGQDPFTLNAGQQVIISADGPGPIIDLALVYLPVTIRPGS